MSDARFLETHALFEGSSDQQGRVIEWFGEHVAPASKSAPYRVLSVGCGSGVADVAIAKALAKRTDNLRYVGVDPNRVECEEFEARFAEAALPGAQLEVCPVPFDAFEPVDARGQKRAFDLVHFVHCLYYMGDASDALRRARRLLAPGGQLVIVQGPRGRLNDLSGRFYAKGYHQETMFAADLAEQLDEWDWAYERDRIDAHVDVTPLLDDPASAKGEALRDFIVQFDSRRLPRKVRLGVDRYLELISSRRNGRRVVPHPADVFVVASV
ncbi:MAG: class I SAM-dependent methyltransferase [Planctomycetota bacterium]